MGCSISRSTVPVNKPGTVAVAPQQPPRTQGPLAAARFSGVTTGLALYFLDEFYSKYTGETLQSWRRCRVRVFDGFDKTSKVCIRFEGATDKHDKWIDLNEEDILCRIAPVSLGLLSADQVERAVAMDLGQQKAAYAFMHTAAAPAPTSSSAPAGEEKKPTSSQRKLGDVDVSVGSKIDVQEHLVKGQEGKWRTAQVIDTVGSKIRVHFIGMDPSWDDILDLVRDKDRIRRLRTMTSMQTGGRPSVLDRSKSEISKRTQRRSFDGDTVRRIPQKNVSDYSPWDLEKEAEDGDEDDEDENTETDTRRSRRIKPKATLDFLGPTPHRKFSTERRHSSSGLEVDLRRAASLETSFCDRLEKQGLYLVEMEPDGNCLFRAVAHQLFLDPMKHLELRAQCVEHMVKNKERFQVFCTSNFEAHCKRMAIDGTWAAELEVRALEEICDRVFSIYSSDSKETVPMSTNFDDQFLVGINVETVKLSYHGAHYNSIFDIRQPLPLPPRSSRILELARRKLFEGQ